MLILYYILLGLRFVFAYKQWKAQQDRTKRCKINYVKQQWEKVADKFPNKDNFAMLNPAYIILGNQCLNADNECDKHKAKLKTAAKTQARAEDVAKANKAKAEVKSKIPKEMKDEEPESNIYGIILLIIFIIAMTIVILNFNKDEGNGRNNMVGGHDVDGVNGVGGGEIQGGHP